MIRIFLDEVLHERKIKMYIMRELHDGTALHAKPVKLSFEEKSEGDAVEPTLVFDTQHGREFLGGLARALAEVGYKVDTSTERGELKATKIHLEDMRSLVFNNLAK